MKNTNNKNCHIFQLLKIKNNLCAGGGGDPWTLDGHAGEEDAQPRRVSLSCVGRSRQVPAPFHAHLKHTVT